MDPLLTSRGKLVYIVNVIFLSTKFLDLPEIKITPRSKNIPNRFCLVKDSHIRYQFQPDRNASDLTSYAQDEQVKPILKLI